MAFDRNYKDSRILVTGGAGFIGSHLSERLLAEGAEVVCADNYFTGSRKNITHLLSNPMFEAIRHNVTFPLYIEVDAIFDLACPHCATATRSDTNALTSRTGRLTTPGRWRPRPQMERPCETDRNPTP